jgi:hypothetical protein
MLRRRRAAEHDAYALNQALEHFTELRIALEAALDAVTLVTGAGASLALPNRRRVVEAIADLADRVDTDPIEARERGKATDLLNGWVTAVASDAHRRLVDLVSRARGGAEPGLASVLRQIGLTDAAATLADALTTLDGYAATLPTTAEEMAEVQQAAEAITSTMQALDDPRYARLLQFVRASMSTQRPTLNDIDAALLEELQTTGAAANFVIVPRS